MVLEIVRDLSFHCRVMPRSVDGSPNVLPHKPVMQVTKLLKKDAARRKIPHCYIDLGSTDTKGRHATLGEFPKAGCKLVYIRFPVLNH